MNNNNLAEIFNFERWKDFIIEAAKQTLEIIGKIWIAIPAPAKWAIAIFFLLLSLAFVMLAYKNKDEWQHVYT